ncbi:hypothetical protein NDU88_004444 [Pleurodeles waltl]|uniref:Uncharacterized protein n=1 Tax=Pleurodeles waltl TaxID=8319 RepID=A0AAV7LIA6_PLEWA|nr:hypothetical protein NDU88_004444 [Pleurodeles waltl]
MQTADPIFAQTGSILQINTSMAPYSGEGAHAHREGAGLSATERGSPPEDEYKPSPRKQNAIAELKELPASAMERKRRASGSQNEAQVDIRATLNKKKGHAKEKEKGATPFPVYSLEWLFSSNKNSIDRGLAPAPSQKVTLSEENIGTRNLAALPYNNISGPGANCKGVVEPPRPIQTHPFKDIHNGVGAAEGKARQKNPAKARKQRNKKKGSIKEKKCGKEGFKEGS